jgi:hypothetical protein
MDKHKTFRSLICTAIVLACAVPCAGQAVESKTRSLQQRVFDPSLDSPIGSPAVQLKLEGTKENGTVKARVGVQSGDWIFDLKLSGPIGEKAEQATLVDLDGLANKATADVGLSWVRWNPTADPVAQRQACVSYLIDTGKARDEADARSLLQKTAPDGTLMYPCTWLSLPKNTVYRDQFDDAINWGTPVLLSVRFKTGREQFKFVRPPSFMDEKLSHNSYAGVASLGVLTGAVGLLRAGYQYQVVYEPKDKSEVCTPIDGSTSLRCRDISIGAPAKKISNIVQFEARKFFSSSLAVNPSVSYDVKDDIWGFQVPIYFFQSKQGGLNGGVAIGWRSDAKELIVKAFVGELFTLIGR